MRGERLARLFTERKRTSDQGANYSEPDYRYLDRSGRPMAGRIRHLLENWFADYPAENRGDLRNRFRSRRPEQHSGALLEFYTHAVLLRLGFEIEVHPEVEGTSRRPDFAARRTDDLVMFVECTTTMPSPAEAGAAQRRFEVVDALDAIESSEWSVGYNSLATGPEPLKKRWFRGEVRRWLATLDREQVIWDYQRTGAYSERQLVRDGWSIVLQAIPLKADAPAGGVRGVYSSEVVRIDTPSRLRKSIVDKSGAYGGNLPAPLLLVVVPGFWYAREHHLTTALLGDEVVIVNWDEHDARRDRKPNGAWVGSSGLRGGRLCAAMFAPRFNAWSLPDAEWQLVHHPAPIKDLPQGSLPIVTEVTWDEEGAAHESTPSSSFREMFDLSEEWPGPDD